ncbi:MAG: hypothetical protein ACREXT_09820 [Gammaproteobacteria bacterium]
MDYEQLPAQVVESDCSLPRLIIAASVRTNNGFRLADAMPLHQIFRRP